MKKSDAKFDNEAHKDFTVLVSITGVPWVCPDIVFFDMDGVITQERNYFEKAWAVLIRRYVHNDVSTSLKNLTDEDILEGSAFRQKYKGEILVNRLQKIIAQSPQVVSIQDCRDLFYQSVRQQQLDEYENHMADYLLPGAMSFLSYLKTQNITTYIVTANEQKQADWVVQKLGLEGFFNGVIGYPENPAGVVSKATIIQSLLEKAGIPPTKSLFIGDGKSDIRFGKAAGVRTLAMSNTEANHQLLLKENPDFIIWSTHHLNQTKHKLF